MSSRLGRIVFSTSNRAIFIILLILVPIIIFGILFSACKTSSSIPPNVIEFSINPSTIMVGDNSTLSWNVTGATSVNIDQGIGKVNIAGTRIVSPSMSANYTLTATNAVGSVTKTVSIVVNIPAPAPESHTITPVYPDNSYIEVTSSIWHYVARDTENCQYDIVVRNKHDTWSIKNVTLKINGVTYKVADLIKPYDNAVFYKVLECPNGEIIYDYEWVAP